MTGPTWSSLGVELGWTDLAIRILVVLGIGTLMSATVGPILRRLPEPAPEPQLMSQSQPKQPYAHLATRRFVLGCAGTAVLATLVMAAVVPVRFWPPWLVLSTVGVLLAWIDGATTWLPWRLTGPGWLATLIGGGACVLLGAGGIDLIRMLGCGLIGWLWYLLIYHVTRRQIGLGDVWLAPLITAPAGLVSFTCLYLALLFGSVIGGLHGLMLLVRRRRGPFPYGPSIVAGGYAALLVSRFVG